MLPDSFLTQPQIQPIQVQTSEPSSEQSGVAAAPIALSELMQISDTNVPSDSNREEFLKSLSRFIC